MFLLSNLQDLKEQSLGGVACVAAVLHPRDRSFIAKQPMSAPHMLHNVPRVGRSYEHFPDGLELHLLRVGINKGFAHAGHRVSLCTYGGNLFQNEGYRGTSPIKKRTPLGP